MNSFQEQPTTDITTPTTTRMPSVGTILASQREQAGMSLEDVAAQLKLSKRQIEALEQDRFDALPGNTFVRGFVRNYARLLHIDPQPLLGDLARVLPTEAPQAVLPRLQDQAMPILRPHRPSKVGPSVIFMLIAVVVALGLASAWYYVNNRHEPQLTLDAGQGGGEQSRPMTPTPVATETPSATPADVSATLVPDARNTPAPTPTEAAQPTEKPVAAATTPTPLPTIAIPATAPAATSSPTPAVVASPTPLAEAAGNTDIRIVAKEDSWIQITDASGKKLLSELVHAGDSRNVAAGTPPYQVRVGNGRNTELYFKGRQIDLLSHLKVDVANVELK